MVNTTATVEPQHHSAPPQRPISTSHLIWIFARLRWRELRSQLRRGGNKGALVVLGAAFAALAALAGAVAVGAFLLLSPIDDVLLVVSLVCTIVVIGVVMLTMTVGLTQPFNVQVIAAEPLSRRQIALGQLAASSAGPAGLATVIIGVVALCTAPRSIAAVPVVLVAVASLLLLVLILGRTANAAASLLGNRFPRLGQLLAGVMGVGSYLGINYLLNSFAFNIDSIPQWVGRVVRYVPGGSLGVAFSDAHRGRFGSANAWLGVLWTLAWAGVFFVLYSWLNARAMRSTRHVAAGRARSLGGWSRWLGTSPSATVAKRTMLIHRRSPRRLGEWGAGYGVALAIIVGPAYLSKSPGGMLVGGGIAYACTLVCSNLFGADGPSLGTELLTGVTSSDEVTGKWLATFIFWIPIVAVAPLLAAALSGLWSYLPASFALTVAGVLIGNSLGVVLSAYFAYPLPDSDNPFSAKAGGSAMVLVLFLLGAVVFTVALLPVAVGLIAAVWLSSTVAVTAVTIAGALYSLAFAVFVTKLSVRRFRSHQPEIIAAITESA